MPLPIDGPFNWSSNVNHPGGAAPWNGQPTKQTPSVGQTSAGFQPDTPFPVEFLNKLLNNTSNWLSYLRDERNLLSAAVAVLQGQVTGILARIVGDEWTYPVAKSRDHRLAIHTAAGETQWTISPTAPSAWTCTSGGTRRALYIPLSLAIKTGSQGFAGEVSLTPGNAGLGVNQMQLQLFRRDLDGTELALGPVTNSDGTTLQQNVLWFGTSTVTVDHSLYTYHLRVLSGQGGGANLVWGCRMAWTDIGPRNW